MDYSSASIAELEAKVREVGTRLLEADERGGDAEETRWCEMIGCSLAELHRRGEEGSEIVARLLRDSNLEVKLSAACSALEKNFEVDAAKSALRELIETRGGNGWPAHYAEKVLARYR